MTQNGSVGSNTGVSTTMNATASSPAIITLTTSDHANRSPFRVLGIAMVVDQRGIGPRLVARYPAKPMQFPSPFAQPSTGPSTTFNPQQQQQQKDHPCDHVFFTLTAHQFAKLFRMKKPLCGQPVTLTIDETFFCCHAVRLKAEAADAAGAEPASFTSSPSNGSNSGDENSISNANSNETNNKDTDETATDDIVQFSIIVALSMTGQATSLSLPNTFTSSGEEPSDTEQLPLRIDSTMPPSTAATATATNTQPTVKSKSRSKSKQPSMSYLSIRRVHLTLARLCRVLHREEMRCHYVSLQAHGFFKLRGEHAKKWGQEQPSSNSTSQLSIANDASSQITSSLSLTPSLSGKAGSLMSSGRHSRNNSFATNPLVTTSNDRDDRKSNSNDRNRSKFNSTADTDESDLEQQILDLFLSNPKPTADGQGDTPNSTSNDNGDNDDDDDENAGRRFMRHSSNIMRELIHVFHALSRNDRTAPPTPKALLSGRDGIVYVNRHIAVPIEAVSDGIIHKKSRPIIRPYSTLLFPHAAPPDLIKAFQSSGSAAPRRLQQFLLTANARKPLKDIAVDANLPLHTTLEMASYLLAHGVCVLSPVVSKSSKLACFQIHHVPQLSQDFSSRFCDLNLFRLVSFLTNSPTLGHATAMLTNVDSNDAQWLRDCMMPLVSLAESSGNLNDFVRMPASIFQFVGTSSITTSSGSSNGRHKQPLSHKLRMELEDILLNMAIWLLSHRVLVQMQDYLVAVDASLLEDAHDTESSLSSPTHAVGDERVFRSLYQLGVLDGTVPVPAIASRCSFDLHQLRLWAQRHSRIRLLTRVPVESDEW